MRRLARNPRISRLSFSRFRAVLLLAFIPFVSVQPGADAQDVPQDVRERSNQFDVPFVASDDNVLKAMFEMAKPTRDDFLIDLGSGDGRIVIAAAKAYGLRGFGVDLNEALVEIANRRATAAGIGDRARFYVRDLFKTDIREATILTMYLLPDIVLELRDRLLKELRPGTRVVSHDYHMGAWRPDETRMVSIGEAKEESVVYSWLVPARVAGTWAWTIDSRKLSDLAVDFKMVLRQHFQDLSGTAEIFPGIARIHDIRLAGDKIALSVTGEVDERIVRHDFTGTIEGDRIGGTVTMTGAVRPFTLPWIARRIKGAE